MNKLILSLVCFSCLLPFLPAQAMEEDDKTLSGIFSYYLPDSSFYKAGAGFDVKYSWWRDDGKAFAVSLGYAQFGLEGTTEVRNEGGGATGVGSGGDVNMIPVGLSAIWRNQTDYNKNLDVSLELGAKYLLADSAADATVVTRTAGGGRNVSESPIDVEDTAVVFLAIDLAMLLDDYSDIVLGVGYNYDFLAGDVSVGSGKFEENEIKGVYFNLGYSRRF